MHSIEKCKNWLWYWQKKWPFRTNDVNVYTALTGTPMILAEEMTDTNQCNPLRWCVWCEHYTYRNTFVMFAKEIFDYPELEEHPLLCNHLGKKTIYLVTCKHWNIWVRLPRFQTKSSKKVVVGLCLSSPFFTGKEACSNIDGYWWKWKKKGGIHPCAIVYVTTDIISWKFPRLQILDILESEKCKNCSRFPQRIFCNAQATATYGSHPKKS